MQVTSRSLIEQNPSVFRHMVYFTKMFIQYQDNCVNAIDYE